MTKHRDLSERSRDRVEENALIIAYCVALDGESLALARQAMIEAFDKEAAQWAEGDD